jgi:hypothetical protein
MIATKMLELVITAWIGSHPITYTLPKVYALTSGACERQAELLESKKRKGARVSIACVPTDARRA